MNMMNGSCTGEPTVLVHYVALIGNHNLVRIIHCCGSLFIQHPLSLLFYMTYHCYCLCCINFKAVRIIWVIKQTNQVSPSNGFRNPHLIVSSQSALSGPSVIKLFECENVLVIVYTCKNRLHDFIGY